MIGSDYSAAMSQIIYKIAPEALVARGREKRPLHRRCRSTSPTASSISPPPGRCGKRRPGTSPASPDLLLVAIDGSRLGDALKYEVSRGGALFPHLYAPLDLEAVLWVKPLPLGADGLHQFPALEAE